jgi:hypothetical protein
MSVLVRFKPVSVTRALYDEVIRRVDQDAGGFPPAGQEYHVCFGPEDDVQVSEIWVSRERFEEFGSLLHPILEEVGVTFSGPPEILEVYNTAAP